MVFVQLYVTEATNGLYFDVPVYGVHNVNIINLQFHDSGGNAQLRVIEVQSDILRFPNSQRQYLMFLNNGQNYINFNAGTEIMPSIKNCDLSGKIMIRLNVVSGNAFNNNTWTLLLGLEID